MDMKKPTITIELPLPTTDNHTYGQRGVFKFMYKEAKEWKLATQEKLKEVWKRKPIETPVWVDVQLFVKRDRDLQGGLKILCDAFEGIVYVNDKQITEMTLHKSVDKENPRCIIKVEKL